MSYVPDYAHFSVDLASRAIPNIQYKELILDPAAHIVKHKSDIISMPRREFSSYYRNYLKMSDAFYHENIFAQNLYGWDDDVDSNALEVHIHNLRKIL